ncbi:MAG: universal stress protein [Leptolyngbyaceae cyanobacterium SM2_5_2]|nr:universal stress protein [Leptolyngbyaceae cyanobacterium SM2_5_2]
MYHKILVAVDNSPLSDTIFAQALELAQATHASLMLVHSLSGEEDGSPIPIGTRLDAIYWAPGTELNLEAWRAEWTRYETENLERLRQFAARAHAAGVEAEFRQLVGSPGKAICNVAQQWGADLIVVGNRGRSGLSELVLGSVSNYVMHRAPCSVLVLKATAITSTEPEHETAAAPGV